MSIGAGVVAIRNNQQSTCLLDAQLDEIIAKHFPIASFIYYDKNGFPKKGIVLDHGYNGRIKISNVETEREYWISWSDVLNYWDGDKPYKEEQ